MRTITVDTTKGKIRVPVYSCYDESALDPYTHIRTVSRGKVKYINVACAFDIETSNVKDARPYAFMYQWQFCIKRTVFFGRTWEEFQLLVDMLKTKLMLSDSRRLVVYVHNLPFEFQFMRRFFLWTDVFLKGNRQPLKAVCNGCIEFRCSYALSNMSLEKFCENTPDVVFKKNDGDVYNYKKIRTPETKLTRQEESYCFCDVAGLCECIENLMKEDDLARIPLTSTGYVRRDFRNEYRKNKKLRELWKLYRLTPETYTICRTAFRGGDTHANYNYVGGVLRDIQSYDIASSYPAAMLLDRYPVTGFTRISPRTWLRHKRMPDYAALLHVRFENIKYIGSSGMPYIPIALCSHVSAWRINDNGRILECLPHPVTGENGYVDLWCTDIDLRIIEHDYTWTNRAVRDVFVAKYGQLPEEHKRQLMHYFRLKTELKGVPGKEYELGKSKNRLNSGYGMMVTDIAKRDWEYSLGEFQPKPHDVAEALDKFYKSFSNFLRYDQGVWVTANARLRLRKMIWEIGEDVVYCDTDSIKCRGDHRRDFDEFNAEIIRQCEQYGYYADDRNGRRRYLGVYEYEGTYSESKTLGAKRYILKEEGDDKYKTTIAGVGKKNGAEFFNKHGIDKFRNGVCISNAGHIVAYYNDDDKHYINVNGCRILTGSNVALIEDRYTLGLTGEYIDLITKMIDNAAYTV